MTTSWARLLDGYEEYLRAVEARLDTDEWVADTEQFVPPPLPPHAATEADRRRFALLRRRARHCEERLQAQLESAREDLRGLGLRREAARAYGDH